MAVYSYKAIDVDRRAISGVVTADTPRQARDQLRRRGLTIQTVSLPRNRGGSIEDLRNCQPFTDRVRSLLRRRSDYWLLSFARELSTMLAVGIPLLDALDSIAKNDSPTGRPYTNAGGPDPQRPLAWQRFRQKLPVRSQSKYRGAILQLREDIASGLSLAQAMRQQPDIFDSMAVHLSEVGEYAGNLDTVLNDLAEFKEQSSRIRGRIGSALIYPIIVCLTGTVVTLFLMTFVVPNLLEALVAEGRPLPFITALVKSASDLLIQRWWLLLLFALAGLGLFLGLTARERGRLAWHRLLLGMPLLGELIRKQAIVRVAMIIATLLRSGVTFPTAIQVVQRSTSNLVLRRGLQQCESAVQAGRDISTALDATKVFPASVLQVFQVGQESGRLEEMLERLATDYDRQVQSAATRLTSVIEPVLIILLAVIVGAIAFATILPILEAGNVF